VLAFHRVESYGRPAPSVPAESERMIYHTDEWLRFVAESQGATPVRAELTENGRVVGEACGLVVSKLGMRIFGSPLPGWTTMYMGFVLEPGVPRWETLEALRVFAFGDLGCVHLEVVDRHLSARCAPRPNMVHDYIDSFETDLTRTEDQIWAGMDSACRRCVRKAEKSGVTIEVADDDAFADDYYLQLTDVFHKQGLVPTYGVERVRALVRCLSRTGQVLLLRARDPGGACIATGIYPGLNRVAQFWGNASFRSGQHLRPNEALNWFAQRHWKQRGAEVFDWGGGGTYKAKYGCAPVSIPRFCSSKYSVLSHLRDAARLVVQGRQRLLGAWHGARGSA
jgi:GNAT acetyltransferase-like protein